MANLFLLENLLLVPPELLKMQQLKCLYIEGIYNLTNVIFDVTHTKQKKKASVQTNVTSV